MWLMLPLQGQEASAGDAYNTTAQLAVAAALAGGLSVGKVSAALRWEAGVDGIIGGGGRVGASSEGGRMPQHRGGKGVSATAQRR
jgi:hypothetical protein